jgi:hypothetical protein
MNQRVRLSTGYFVQNLSGEDCRCQIDFVVQPGWRLLVNEDEVKTGPAAYQFALKVPPLKTAVKEFVEERAGVDKLPLLPAMPEGRVKELLAHAAASAEVKAALTKSLALWHKIHDATVRRNELEKQRGVLAEDQGRMRQNLNIIPQASEHYKKFLEKFVAQETEMDSLQKQLREAQATLQQLQREYDVFVANLTVE